MEFPDGEIIDIHHFLLGVEGLIDDGRRSDDRTVYADLDSLPLPSWLPPFPEGSRCRWPCGSARAIPR